MSRRASPDVRPGQRWATKNGSQEWTVEVVIGEEVLARRKSDGRLDLMRAFVMGLVGLRLVEDVPDAGAEERAA